MMISLRANHERQNLRLRVPKTTLKETLFAFSDKRVFRASISSLYSPGGEHFTATFGGRSGRKRGAKIFSSISARFIITSASVYDSILEKGSERD